jgi:succinoglycan biosynthesis protein ExoV
MKIQHYEGPHPNFGDDLNLWMWPRLIENFFDEDDSVLFIGIGSIIGLPYNPASKKIIFGAGMVPQYHKIPDVLPPDWDVYFVRGPRTAQALGLSPDLAVGDSAILLRSLVDTTRRTNEVVSFMPHWDSLDRGNWEKACNLAGINLIDPRQPVDQIIDELLRTRLLISEAMHGAIVADAFRIPWIAVRPIAPWHRDKWFDWAESLKIDLRPRRLWPSNLFEIKLGASHAQDESTATAGISKIEDRAKPIGLGKMLRKLVAISGLRRLAQTLLVHLAGFRLWQLTHINPSLSEDRQIDHVTEIMMQKIEKLKQDYRR